MREYEVSVKVEGYVRVQVSANSVDEAESKACNQVGEMDFGPLSDIEWDVNRTGVFTLDLGPVEGTPDTKPEYRYFELWLMEDGDNPNSVFNVDMLIRGVREPTIEEANDFVDEERHQHGPNHVLHVAKITEWTRDEAEEVYDMSNEENWPVFGIQRKYKVEFCYEDDFPVTVLETDDLEEALDCADCFTTPEGWEEDEENDGEYSVLMSVVDTTINCYVYWTNNDGDRGSDAKDDYSGLDLIEARL